MKWLIIDNIYSKSTYLGHTITRYQLKTGKHIYLFEGVSFNTLTKAKQLIDYKIAYTVDKVA